MSQYLEKTVSNMVPGQFPAFYQEEGGLFIEFVREFYQWMESVTPSRANTWISEGISSLRVEAGNTQIVGTNTRLLTNFANGDSIAISRDANTNAYEIYTINVVSNSTFLTITSEPTFSSAKSKFTTVSNTGNPVFIARHFDEIQDIDDTFENFLVHFKEKYLKNLKFLNVTNTRTLVKHSLDLYRSKGTERALELLFRIAYGITPSVYYPASDLLKPSDGHWKVPLYLELTMNPRTVEFVNKEIRGLRSGATAFAEAVIRRSVGTKLIDVLYISSPNGAFEYGEPINTTDGLLNPQKCPIMIGSLTRVNIARGGIGTGFEIGDVLSVSSERGQQGEVVVRSTANTSGIINFRLEDGGYGYSNTPTVVVSEQTLTVSNVVVTNSSPYFKLGDRVIQPLANIAYISANHSFANGDLIYTFYANNDPKGTGRILSLDVTNATSGTILVSVLTGNLQSSQFFLSANAGVANQSVYINQTAWGNVVGVGNVQTISFSNASGFFANGDTVYQYSNSGAVTGQGTVFGNVTSLNGLLRLENATGVFNNSSLIYNSDNTSSANVSSVAVKVGIQVVGSNSFVNTGINYFYSPNGSANGTVTLISTGSGANVTFSPTLLYPEYINVATTFLSPYLSVALNATAYSLPGDSAANLTSNTIANCLVFSNVQIGTLSGVLSMAVGSDYNDSPIVRVLEDKTRLYHQYDNISLDITGVSGGFARDELVTQDATGARGLVLSQNSTALSVRRLNFWAANTFVPTVNSTTTILGNYTGSTANVTGVEFKKPTEISEIGEDAIVLTDLNVANGAITSVDVISSGFGFVDGEPVRLTSSNGMVMPGNASLITYGFGRGYYRDRGGFLSDDKKIFDGDFYQYFSYQIRSSKTLDTYQDMVKSVVHVAGTKIFGDFVYDSHANVNSNVTTTVSIS